MVGLDPHERLVFPLDVAGVKEAVSWVQKLSPFVGVFKIGLELFVASGPKVVERVRKAGAKKIFLDLKFCDIPNTVAGAVRSASELGVDWITVHTLSGEGALKKAVENAYNNLKIVAVTILTSLDRADLMQLGFYGELARDPRELAFRLGSLAVNSGCDGIVCSAREVARIKEAFPQVFTVVPGIRLEENDKKRDDQLRTATPYEAVLYGADYLVVGRPVREAENPEAVCQEILNQVEAALKERNKESQ